MSPDLPTVSVVIPASGAADALPRALDSLADQTYPNLVEVIVAAADEASSAAAADRAKVVPNPTGTTPSGLNLAFAESRGDVVVRCDAQSRLPADYVERAVETLMRTNADVVGGMQVPVGQTKWERSIAAAMTSPLGAGDARYRIGGAEGPVETVYLGVFRRTALERMGGFDEEFVRNQDYELNHRIIESGGVVWLDPRLRVEYRPRGSLETLASQYFDYGRAKRLFLRKHPGSIRWRQALPPVLVVVLVLSLLGSIWLPALLAVPVLYLVAMWGAGMQSAGSSWQVAAALITMHVSWGLGFLTGTDFR